jgi:hypothetical protein
VNIFPLHLAGKAATLTVCTVRHRQRYLAHYARYFLELTGQYFSKLERQQLTHIAKAGCCSA